MAIAAAERAVVMSTSSTSFEISLNAFLHSSAKGPKDVSFEMTPTFFYTYVSISVQHRS